MYERADAAGLAVVVLLAAGCAQGGVGLDAAVSIYVAPERWATDCRQVPAGDTESTTGGSSLSPRRLAPAGHFFVDKQHGKK